MPFDLFSILSSWQSISQNSKTDTNVKSFPTPTSLTSGSVAAPPALSNTALPPALIKQCVVTKPAVRAPCVLHAPHTPCFRSAAFLAGPWWSQSLPLPGLLGCSFTQDLHVVPPSLHLASCLNVSPAGMPSMITTPPPPMHNPPQDTHTYTHTYFLSLSVHQNISFKEERISFSSPVCTFRIITDRS